jgi:hypothetical protein
MISRIAPLTKRTWPVLLMLIGAAVAILMFWFSLSRHDDWKDMVQSKAYEATYQFFLVAVIGGGLSFFYRLYEQGRDKRRMRADFIRRYHDEVVHAFYETKRIRRSLRAKSMVDNGRLVINRRNFEKLLFELEKVQLELEHLVRKVTLNSTIFDRGSRAGEERRTTVIKQNMRLAENYVRNALNEFEDGRHQSDCPEDVIEIRTGDKLYEFIVRSEILKNERVEILRERCLSVPLRTVEAAILNALRLETGVGEPD